MFIHLSFPSMDIQHHPQATRFCSEDKETSTKHFYLYKTMNIVKLSQED